MAAKFFLVNFSGYVLPYEYNSYETAAANCGPSEMVFVAESLEELEYCLYLNTEL